MWDDSCVERPLYAYYMIQEEIIVFYSRRYCTRLYALPPFTPLFHFGLVRACTRLPLYYLFHLSFYRDLSYLDLSHLDLSHLDLSHLDLSHFITFRSRVCL
jgi:hypothetical protein